MTTGDGARALLERLVTAVRGSWLGDVDPDLFAALTDAEALLSADPLLIVPDVDSEADVPFLVEQGSKYRGDVIRNGPSIAVPQPGQPTMNMLIDEHTGKTGTALAHLPVPGEPVRAQDVRQQAAERLLAAYERAHGEITHAELDALETQWRT